MDRVPGESGLRRAADRHRAGARPGRRDRRDQRSKRKLPGDGWVSFSQDRPGGRCFRRWARGASPGHESLRVEAAPAWPWPPKTPGIRSHAWRADLVAIGSRPHAWQVAAVTLSSRPHAPRVDPAASDPRPHPGSHKIGDAGSPTATGVGAGQDCRQAAATRAETCLSLRQVTAPRTGASRFRRQVTATRARTSLISRPVATPGARTSQGLRQAAAPRGRVRGAPARRRCYPGRSEDLPGTAPPQRRPGAAHQGAVPSPPGILSTVISAPAHGCHQLSGRSRQMRSVEPRKTYWRPSRSSRKAPIWSVFRVWVLKR